MRFFLATTVVVIAILFAIISWPAEAAEPECYAEVGAYSYHFLDRENEINYNENNPLVGLTCNKKSLIVFKNSHSNWTGFANYRFDLYVDTWVDIGLRAGAFWSEKDYLFGLDFGPAASVEVVFFENYAVSFLGEAVSFHWRVRF